MDEKKHNQALKYFDMAEQFFHNNRNLMFIKGVIYSELGEKVKAIRIFEKIIKNENFFGPAFRLLSLLKYKINRETLDAIENYLDKSEKDGLNEIHLGLALSNFLENNGDFEKFLLSKNITQNTRKSSILIKTQ